MQQPTMFCHDGTTIFYPTGPGRVHMITIAALADCDGSDEDLSDSTATGDIMDLVISVKSSGGRLGVLVAGDDLSPPDAWPAVYREAKGVITDEWDQDATTQDFADCLEQWADWCDRDSARLDSLDEIMGAVEVAA